MLLFCKSKEIEKKYYDEKFKLEKEKAAIPYCYSENYCFEHIGWEYGNLYEDYTWQPKGIDKEAQRVKALILKHMQKYNNK
jgi:hypothetical protein